MRIVVFGRSLGTAVAAHVARERPVAGAVLVFIASFDRNYIMAPGWIRSVFLWVGTRSYAIYLIHIPAYSDGTLREWGQQLQDECAAFPKGSTDDMVDALSQGLKHLRDCGLLVRREERSALIEEMRRHKPQSTPLYPT